MKNLVWVLLLTAMLSSAQPSINYNTTPYEVCDNDQNGLASFDLLTKNAEILDSVSPLEFSLTYHETYSDAVEGQFPIDTDFPYQNIIPFSQTIWVKVKKIDTPEYFAITSFLLIVNAAPIVPSSVPDIIVYEDPFDGLAIFNLTIQEPYILNGQNGMSVTYYNSLTDAMNNNSAISTPTNLANVSNPQTFYAKVSNNQTGCFAVTHFQVSIQQGIPITNPTSFIHCEPNPDGISTFNLNEKKPEILGSLPSSQYYVSFYRTLADAQNNSFQIPDFLPFTNEIPFTQTLYVRVGEIANLSNIAITTLHLVVYQMPSVISPTQDLINPVNGSTTFNLALHENYLLNGVTSNSISYHLTLSDAENEVNPIFNVTSFEGTDLQQIYVRIVNPYTSCYSTNSFTLRMFNPNSVVYIPDANFKAKLIAQSIDTNFDGEIQYSEAEAAQPTIDVSNSNISDLTGLEAFVNTTSFHCNNNTISTIYLSTLTNLLYLECGYNDLTTIDVGSNTNLSSLILNNNQITIVENLNSLVNLQVLNLSSNNFSSIELNGLTSLYGVNLTSNHLTTLDLSIVPQLTSLNISQNSFVSIDVSPLNNLQFLLCNGNQISNLDLSNNSILSTLVCYSNQIQNLDVSNLSSLGVLDCRFNQLSELSIAGTNLSGLKCSFNPITNLDITGTVGFNDLTGIECSNTNITSLDLTNTVESVIVDCSNNNLLKFIFIKNGLSQEGIIFNGNPSLEFICADEDYETNFIKAMADSYGYTNCVVNSYCSFTPGGNYNTITGAITYDSNNNGCDELDTPYPNIRVNINDGTNSGSTFIDADGNYRFYTDSGSFTISPQIENPAWFLLSPASSVVNFTNNNNNVSTQNFCVSPIGLHMDLEVVIEPVTPARPGFIAVYKLVYRNKGNVTAQFNSGVRFDYNPNQMTFVSASQPVGNQGVDFINFDYTNLMPFESREIIVTFSINSPTSTNPVTIGDVLLLHSNIGLNIGDENPIDNDFYYNQIVVGSYDPNDITCLQGETAPTSEIGNYLHYVVNFENTGNYYAENVVVKLDIDPTLYDISTLQLLNTSHPSYTRINGNQVEFIFEGIYLDAVGGNPPVGGHGNVLFKIKSKDDLNNGDSVAKRADIYFDYNAPIDTNMAVTTFQSLNNSIFEFDGSITVFPNPTNGNITINSKFNIKSVELYDIQGRILETVIENSNESILDVSKRQNGIYFLKITTDEGNKVEKIIKE